MSSAGSELLTSAIEREQAIERHGHLGLRVKGAEQPSIRRARNECYEIDARQLACRMRVCSSPEPCARLGQTNTSSGSPPGA